MNILNITKIIPAVYPKPKAIEISALTQCESPKPFEVLRDTSSTEPKNRPSYQNILANLKNYCQFITHSMFHKNT